MKIKMIKTQRSLRIRQNLLIIFLHLFLFLTHFAPAQMMDPAMLGGPMGLPGGVGQIGLKRARNVALAETLRITPRPYETNSQSAVIWKYCAHEDNPSDRNHRFIYLYPEDKPSITQQLSIRLKDTHTNKGNILRLFYLARPVIEETTCSYDIFMDKANSEKWQLREVGDLFHWLEMGNRLVDKIYYLNPDTQKKEPMPNHYIGFFTNIIDLYQDGAKRPSETEMKECNRLLFRDLYGMVSEKEYHQCIQEALKRYQQQCKEYKKTHPKTQLPEYSLEDIQEAMSKSYSIENGNDNYYFHRISNNQAQVNESILSGKIRWIEYQPSNTPDLIEDSGTSFHSRSLSSYALESTLIICPECGTENEAGSEFCSDCGADLTYISNYIQSVIHSDSAFVLPLGKFPTTESFCNLSKEKYYTTNIEAYILRSRSKAMSYSSSGYKIKSLPRLEFDHRIGRPCEPLLQPLGNLVTNFKIEEKTRPFLRKTFLSDHKIVLCDFHLWKTLTEKEQFELKKYCFNKCRLIIYHAPEEKHEYLGAGIFIMIKNGYWETDIIQRSLSKPPVPDPVYIQAPDALQNIRHKFKVHSYTLALGYLLIAFPISYLFCLKKRKLQYLLIIIPMHGILFSAIMFMTTQFFFTTGTLVTDIDCTFLDQQHQIKQQDIDFCFQQTVPKKKNFILSPDYDYYFWENFDRPYFFESMISAKYTIQNHQTVFPGSAYIPGKEALICANRIVQTREKIIWNQETQTITNHLDSDIEKILIFKNQKSYFARNIKKGKTQKLAAHSSLIQNDRTGILTLCKKAIQKKRLEKFFQARKDSYYIAQLKPSDQSTLKGPLIRKNPIALQFGIFSEGLQ